MYVTDRIWTLTVAFQYHCPMALPGAFSVDWNKEFQLDLPAMLKEQHEINIMLSERDQSILKKAQPQDLSCDLGAWGYSPTRCIGGL